jgi:uncharacterized protein (DUF2235 family)
MAFTYDNYKRLIVCCDGTWQSSNCASQTSASNVTKISRAIAHASKQDGVEIEQVVYYQSGVGSGSLTYTGAGFQGPPIHFYDV